MTNEGKWIAVTAMGLALAGCVKGSGAQGGLRGRVVGVDGQAASGARVMLDKTTGKSVLASATGEFHLATSAGVHHLLVYQPGANAAAAATVTVQADADVNVGNVVLEDCGLITADGSAGGGTATPDPTASPTDPNDPTDPMPPCQVDPPPPPPASIHFDSLSADYASGTIDPSGLYGWGEDDSKDAGFSFFLAGDFTSGGAATVHVADASATDGAMQLFVWDANSGWGYAYELVSGDLTVSVAAEPAPTSTATPESTPSNGPCVGADGAPCEPCDGPEGTTNTPGGAICSGGGMHFDFQGTNLTFVYVDWDGVTQPDYVATVNGATASGDAWVFVPPPPPPANVNVTEFVADDVEIFDCAGCGVDPSGSTAPGTTGDVLYVYAYDSVDGVDLSYYLPVSDLSLPGTVTLDASSIYGSADVYSGGWLYTFDNGSFSSTSSAVTDGESLNLSIASQTFDWTGDGYAQPLASGGGAPTPASASTLTIVGGDLSGLVQVPCGTPVAVSGGGSGSGTASGGVVVN